MPRLFAVSTTNLYLLATGISAYALLEGVEAAGLWAGKRWAEYLTFIATVIFVPYEVYELTPSITALKVVTLIINLVIVIYLVVGGTAVRAARRRQGRTGRYEQDTGWEAIERATPRPGRTPSAVPPETAVAPETAGIPGSHRVPRKPPRPGKPPYPRKPPRPGKPPYPPETAASQEVPVPPERPATGAAGR